jgi:hypothetical protein
MTNDEFATPAAPGGIDWQGLHQHLLLVEPLSNETGISTVHGPTNAVRASVSVLDGPAAGTVHEDALIFPKVLQGQVRSKIGQKVLGRLGQGVAKPGQTAPWMLLEATPQDVETARRFLASRKVPGLTQPNAPATHQQPAAQVPGQGWGQQPQQPTQHAEPPF